MTDQTIVSRTGEQYTTLPADYYYSTQTKVLTNTTTIDTTLGSVVTDTSIIPYMRKLPIQFLGMLMRPNKQVWFFFDDKIVNNYIQNPNVIEIDRTLSDDELIDIRSGIPSKINVGTNFADVWLKETKLSDGKTRLYVSNFSNANASIAVTNKLNLANSANIANVTSYTHYSGVAKSTSTSTSIVLQSDASSSNGDYLRNTITIVSGPGAGQTAEIIDYKVIGSVKTAYLGTQLVGTDFGNTANPTIYSIGDSRVKYVNTEAEGFKAPFYVTERGFIPGVLHIPDPVSNDLQFRTGTKLFRIIDNYLNDYRQGSFTTIAEYKFVANGLDLSEAQIINRQIISDYDINITLYVPPTPTPTPTPTRTPTPTSSPSQTPTSTPTASPTPSKSYVPPTPTPTRTPTPTPSRKTSTFKVGTDLNFRSWEDTRRQDHDPIAETFFVSSEEHPSGLFITSVDLFFRNKGEILPVELQIRPTENGQPSSNTVIPHAIAIRSPEEIKTSFFPNVANSQTSTNFKFGSPVYLAPGFEYSIVVLSDDYGYDYYVAEKGQTILGTDQIISKQPYLGSLFKSQNSRTWTPIQNEDMMFVINRAEFTSESGTVIFNENKNAIREQTTANTPYDSFEVRSDAIELNRTSLTYRYKGVSNASGALESAYTTILPDKKMDLFARRTIREASNTSAPYFNDPSYYLRIDMNTSRTDISPVVFQNRQLLTTIENKINNGNLSNNRFVIVNGGNNYDSNTFNIEIQLTSTQGQGANAYARAANGNIVAIYMRSEGAGYFGNVTANVVNSGAGSGNGNNAIIQVISEVGQSGGPAEARYISKTVTLLDGFDAGDLRVYLTAVRPPGSNVFVYYKVRNALDGDPIEKKNWVQMVQKTSDVIFTQYGDPIEYEFRPSLTSNSISYTSATTTYRTFNQYAIKVVMASDDTIASKIPYVYDLRAIALPEDVY